MAIAALLELGIVDLEYLKTELKKLKLEDYELSLEKDMKLGMSASYFEVRVDGVPVEDACQHEHSHGDHDHSHEHSHSHSHTHDQDHEHNHDHDHHHGHQHDHNHGHSHEHDHENSHSHSHDHVHRNIYDIEEIIDNSELNQRVKDLAKRIFKFIAVAESKIHNMDYRDLHFHEVGALDSIVDIVGFSILLDAISPSKIYSSDLHVGRGFVNCAHGVMPVPAPATLEIIKDAGIPVFSRGIRGEITTPTGAAILAAVVDEYSMPDGFVVEKIGYGSGKKDLEIPNILRVSLGDIKKNSNDIIKIEFEVDDMTGEELGYLMELADEHVLDISYKPVQMKKNRPGTSVQILCTEEKFDEISELVFEHSTTIGFRHSKVKRLVMDRSEVIHTTELGKIREKISKYRHIEKSKFEYDDLTGIINTDRKDEE